MWYDGEENNRFAAERMIRAEPGGKAMKLAWKSEETAALTGEDRAQRVQFACLLAVLAVILAFLLLEDRAEGIAYLYAQKYLALPAMVFLGASFCRAQTRQGKWHLLGGLAMVTLFFLTQTAHQLLESEHKEVGTFLCAYALCLPYAAATADAKRQRGLTWTAGMFLAVGVVLTGYAGLLLLDAVPAYLKVYVYWDGSRLLAMGHPNICATLLMISMALSAGFALKSRKRWVRAGLLLLTVLQFAAMSLTNGRTTIILTCLLLGGITFCALRGRGWKRFALALLAAAVVMAGAFGLSRGVYRWNQTRLAESVQVDDSPSETPAQKQFQGSLAEDMKTLNGRTIIWRRALLGLRENPQVKYVGTEYVELLMTRYSGGTICHTHNSWLEALYRMGLPGLMAALVITVLALWSAGVVLWRNADIWHSCVALLTLCLLGCALLEPYLFVADVSYYYLDCLFLMCLGYLCLWRKEKAA